MSASEEAWSRFKGRLWEDTVTQLGAETLADHPECRNVTGEYADDVGVVHKEDARAHIEALIRRPDLVRQILHLCDIDKEES